jgi:hypothetical protein
MKRSRLLSVVCGIMLSIGVLTGCVAMPDGSTGPDYAGIELGSVIAMTVLVNEVKATQAVKDLTYARLTVMHSTLSCPDTGRIDCPPINLKMIPEMLANALPMEYQALAPAMTAYIESRVRMYYDVKIPTSPENVELIRKMTVVVIGGALQALAPHVSK